MTVLASLRSSTLTLIGWALITAACGETAREVSPTPQEAAPPVVESSAPTPSDLLPNGAEPFPGVLTGGLPTLDQLAAARAAGYGTAIDLRLPEEGGPGRQEVEAAGMRYVSIPIKDGPDLSPEKAQELARALKEADGKAIVYCSSGNRVGALFAMKAYHVDGLSPEEALALGKAAGLRRLETYVKSRLGLEAIPD